ncbi:MAG: type IV pilus twitching motility protein PilT [Clostridia bacterium]|nr:type IV pilus twitching motility protein PilT [Clostridia bacterium]
MEFYEKCEGDKYVRSINDLLSVMPKKDASDLHLVAGVPPCYRIDKELLREDLPPLNPENVKYLLSDIIGPEDWNKLEQNFELDFSYAIPGIARYRGNVMVQRGSIAAVFRAVPFEIPEFDKLGLPQELKALCNLKRGLVLVTGPTGSGKSTTLASIIDIINRTRKLNIVTIEDPIEFLHKHKLSTVRQREIGGDTHSFANALRHVLRHDPDVILVGEMRDLESISIALTAAETGHLVFSTLHTQTAPSTINRIIDVFSESERKQVRQQLAATVQGVISQQLLPKNGGGKVVAIEYMTGVSAVRNLIREGKEHQIYSVMQTGHEYGMVTMDTYLIELYKKGKITEEVMREHCVDAQEIDRIMSKEKTASPHTKVKDLSGW